MILFLLATSDIAFYARPTQDQSMTAFQDLKFDQVITNQGNAYDAISGRFTAPVHGLYQFSVSVMVDARGKLNEDYDMGFHVMKNDMVVGNLWCFYTYSATLDLLLVPGDVVHVRKDDDPTSETLKGKWSSFSGHLVREY